MNVIHFVEYPLPGGHIVAACGTQAANLEDITGEKDHVTCLRCRGTRKFWTLPFVTSDQ